MSEEYLDQKSEEEVHQEDSSDELTEEFELSNTDEEWSDIVDHALEEEVNVEDDEEFGEWLDENYDLEYIEEEGDPEEEEDDEDEEGDIEEKRMSAAAKAKAKKYRASAAGKKAIARYKKKSSKAGYKVDKSRARAMKKAAMKNEFDPELDEDQDIDEKRMSAAAKAKAAKYRKSAAGKKAIAKYKKKASKAGYKVDKKRAKAMKKAALKQSYEIPTTKNQMLKNIYDQVNGMLKGDLAGKYEEIMNATNLEVVEEEVQEEVRIEAAVKPEDIKVDVKDDVEALVQGEEGLTEEFKTKASTIFEAAVQAKVTDEVNKKIAELEAQSKENAEQVSEDFKKEMTEKVDGYLSYVVEEWMKENELAIERGIRSELVEDFMTGLKTLFTEHYIDIPEEKVDMVDDLFTKVEDLEGQLEEEINRGVGLQKELAQFKKDSALRSVTKDLADTESEKISKLAEGIEYENEEQYIEKLNVLKESYFPKSDAVTSEITETDETIEVSEEQGEPINESMSVYTQALKRYHK